MIYTPPPTPPVTPGQPAQAPNISSAPSAARAASGRRYTLVFGVVIAVVTALALGLAALAPQLGAQTSAAAPSGWNALYQGDLTAATPNDYKVWDMTHGCSFFSDGLHAEPSDSVSAVCDFTLAGQGGESVAGFYMRITLAPAALTPAFERAMLVVGDTTSGSGNALTFTVGQDGSYVICDGACASRASAVYIAGGAVAWHSDAWVANTMAVLVSADHTHIVFSINGQQIAAVTENVGTNPGLAVGAPPGDGAIFTAVLFSTGE